MEKSVLDYVIISQDLVSSVNSLKLMKQRSLLPLGLLSIESVTVTIMLYLLISQ